MQKNESALRYNSGKNDLALIPYELIEGVGKVMTYGKEKYTIKDEQGNIICTGANNWRKGMSWTSVLSSLKRHLLAFEKGEDKDPESNLLHLEHVAANIGFLLNFYNTHPELDDRIIPSINSEKRIALDIDGCLSDYTLAFVKYAAKKGIFVNEEDVDNWQQQHWNFPYSMQPLWNEIIHNKQFWLNIPVIEKNRHFNFEPVIYLSTRPIPVEWTKEWLEKNGFPCESVFHVDGYKKSEICKEYKIDILVDDCWKNVVECQKNSIFAYLMDTNYNRKYKIPEHRRITSLSQI